MKIEASPGERRQWRAVTPIARQKAARLAGGGAGHSGALDHRRRDPPTAEEVGDRRADDPAAANHDVHAISIARSNRGALSLSHGAMLYRIAQGPLSRTGSWAGSVPRLRRFLRRARPISPLSSRARAVRGLASRAVGRRQAPYCATGRRWSSARP